LKFKALNIQLTAASHSKYGYVDISKEYISKNKNKIIISIILLLKIFQSKKKRFNKASPNREKKIFKISNLMNDKKKQKVNKIKILKE
jgi:hypothetical protein